MFYFERLKFYFLMLEVSKQTSIPLNLLLEGIEDV